VIRRVDRDTVAEGTPCLGHGHLPRHQDQRACGAAGFQIAMRIGGVRKIVTCRRFDLDDTLAKRAEKAGDVRRELVRRIGIVSVVRPRNGERLGREAADVPIADRPRSLAEADEMAAHGERGERAGERVVANRIVGNGSTHASGQPHDRLGEIFPGIDDDMVGSETLDDARLVIARHRGDDRRTEMAGPLHQQLADAARRRMDEHDVTRPDSVDVVQEETGCDTLEQTGRGDLV